MRRRSTLGIAILIAFAVIVGFGLRAINQDSSTQNKQAASEQHLMDAYVGHFGEVSGEGVLAAAISRRGPVTVGATAQQIVGGDALSLAAERCAKIEFRGVAIDLLATGTLSGEGVAIIVAAQTSKTVAQVAYVTDLDQCTIVYSERL